jgi:hypothetical protein
MRGYKEFMRATAKAEKESKKVIHAKLREAADVVREDAAQRFQGYDSKTAAGFRIRSRIGEVFVEQRLRKTTRQHPEYGTLQMMAALEPALDAKSGEVEERVDQALSELVGIFG